MLDNDIIRHAREFQRDLNNHKYDVSDEGILFPKSHVWIAGEYEDNYGKTPNLVPTEGLNHLLMVALRDTAKLNTFYLALFTGDYTPTAGITAATFTATANELTSNTEGYAETVRQTWTSAAASAGSIDSYASKADFTIATASSVVIRGAALLSSSAKGGTTGVLVSIARFAAARTEYNGNLYSLGYRVTASAS